MTPQIQGTEIPADIKQRQEDTLQYAHHAMEVVQMLHGSFFGTLPMRMNAIVTKNASVRSKRNQIRILALDINDKITGQTACRTKCNHCCHIPVMLTSAEAEVISEKTGIKYERKPGISFTPEDSIKHNKVEKYLETRPSVGPCTFLGSDGGCTIYEHRPLMCITHHSLDKTDYFCRPEVPVEFSTVPTISTHFIHQHNAALDLNFIIADIRQFFPAKSSI